MVVWGGNGVGIEGRRYSDTASRSCEFSVSSYGSPAGPAIAAHANGDFVLLWDSWGSAGSDSDGTSIQARRFANATPVPALPAWGLGLLAGLLVGGTSWIRRRRRDPILGR